MSKTELSLHQTRAALKGVDSSARQSCIKRWKHLRRKPGSASRQLFIKNTRIMASAIPYAMTANGLTVEEAADDFGVPLEVAQECVLYGKIRANLIKSEIYAGLADRRRIEVVH